jgi:electron transfer flavoprotein alpha subunit
MSDGERRDPRSLRREARRPEARRSAGTPSSRAAGAAPDAAGAAPDIRRIAQPSCLILAVPDLDGGRLGAPDRDLLAAARLLADARGGAVATLAIDAAADADFAAAGADRIIRIELGGYAPEARAAAVVAAIAELQPKHVLFSDTPAGGGDLGRRVAARRRERPATAIRALAPAEIVRSGGGHRIDLTGAPPLILLLLPHAAELAIRDRHEALPLAAPAFERAGRLADRGLLPVDPDAVPLPEALLICSAGNGVTDWVAFRAVAAALGATPAGSRVVCDARALTRDRQVGASGTAVEARCYLAFGISGAPQHLQGITRCESVIAVNTDPHAPMMQRADLAIVADAQAVMPALARLLAGPSDGEASRDNRTTTPPSSERGGETRGTGPVRRGAHDH